MKVGSLIKLKRRVLKCSQVEFVGQSKVSLPSIQNLEAEKANPSLSTLTRVLDAIGYTLNIVPKEPDWEKLIAFGLPLVTE